MKKIILLFILLIVVFFIPNNTYGQDIFSYEKNVPGLTCGIAGDKTGKDKCCSLPKEVQCNDEGFSVLKVLVAVANPVLATFVNKKIDNYIEGCNKIKDFVNQTDNVSCIAGEPTTSNFSDPSCKCVGQNTTSNANIAVAEMCYKFLGSATQANELKGCLSCSSQNGIWTGMGCLPLDINALISGFILNTGIGLGGGLALLCIIYAAFLMQSSQGNPEKLKKAQEMITSCIMGLMLIIFSVFIMRLIGVNILRIPGFGG